MIEDFVPFAIAKKLKEKGFSCEIPFAMYNEIACFCLLTTAAPMMVCASGFKCLEYYDYEDFDEHDYIAPTIYQVLKWLREEKGLHIEIRFDTRGFGACIDKYDIHTLEYISFNPLLSFGFHKSYEEAVIEGIKYALDKLI